MLQFVDIYVNTQCIVVLGGIDCQDPNRGTQISLWSAHIVVQYGLGDPQPLVSDFYGRVGLL